MEKLQRTRDLSHLKDGKKSGEQQDVRHRKLYESFPLSHVFLSWARTPSCIVICYDYLLI